MKKLFLAVVLLIPTPGQSEIPLTADEVMEKIYLCLETDDPESCVDDTIAQRPNWHISLATDPITDKRTVGMAVVADKSKGDVGNFLFNCLDIGLFSTISTSEYHSEDDNKVILRIDGGEPIEHRWRVLRGGDRLGTPDTSIYDNLLGAQSLIVRTFPTSGIHTMFFDVSSLADENYYLLKHCGEFLNR